MKRGLFVASIGACLLANSVASADETYGRWRFWRSADSMTDEVSFTIAAMDGEDTALVITCVPGGFANSRISFIHFPWLGSGQRSIYYRFDDAPMEVSEDWSYDDKSASIKNRYFSAKFFAKLRAAKHVRFRALDVSFNPIDADIDIAGAGDAIDVLSAACAPASQK